MSVKSILILSEDERKQYRQLKALFGFLIIGLSSIAVLCFFIVVNFSTGTPSIPMSWKADPVLEFRWRLPYQVVSVRSFSVYSRTRGEYLWIVNSRHMNRSSTIFYGKLNTVGEQVYPPAGKNPKEILKDEHLLIFIYFTYDDPAPSAGKKAYELRYKPQSTFQSLREIVSVSAPPYPKMKANE